MAQPYVGEIRMFAGNFAPAGWMFCEGQLLPISENETLFQLIGTTFGGDGQSTFGLPDLRGRTPVHQGNGLILAEAAGTEAVTLTIQQIPSHTHPMIASTNVSQDTSPAGKIVGQAGGGALPYIQDVTDSNLAPQAVSSIGGSQPHTNIQPYLCVDFIISLFGIFPSPT
ncbi:MAG: tail fiber protein [Allosphingosinicella sp.]